MSIVVARKVGTGKDKYVEMISDTQSTVGTLKFNGTKKIFDIEGFIFGIVGEYSLLNTIKDNLRLTGTESIGTVTELIRDLLPDTEDDYGLDILVGFEDKLYQIDCSLSYFEINDFHAIGSGCAVALGHMNSTKFPDLCDLKEVIENVNSLDIYCSGVSEIYTTKKWLQ